MKNLNCFTGLMARSCLVAGLAFLSSACEQQEEVVTPSVTSTAEEAATASNLKVYYGKSISLGKGSGRSWVAVDKTTGQPLSIGLELSAKAINDQGPAPKTYSFDLPAGITVAPFDHIDLGWNPAGHPPTGTYDLPHFDMHFYFLKRSNQAKITGVAPDSPDKYADAVPKKYIPADYVLEPGRVPNMGAHYVDMKAPEFNGQKFSKTYIYGAYNKKLIFLEPMITLDYLKKTTLQVTEIRQPKAYTKTGHYPSHYTISYDAKSKTYRVSLDNLKLYTAPVK